MTDAATNPFSGEVAATNLISRGRVVGDARAYRLRSEISFAVGWAMKVSTW